MAEADEDYFLPLTDQRVFGAGIKRKRIAFIPAKDSDASTVQNATSAKANIGDRYLSIVLGKDRSGDQSASAGDARSEVEAPTICAVCQQQMTKSEDKIAINSHESSIAHQVCLEHSHPPSHLDRSNVGLRYLEEYGWDPDSRKGLGARNEGIRIPIKTKQKNDTAGLKEEEDKENIKTRKKTVAKKEEPVVMLDAGKVRKQQEEARKRAEKLRHDFYGRDLEPYLGPND